MICAQKWQIIHVRSNFNGVVRRLSKEALYVFEALCFLVKVPP